MSVCVHACPSQKLSGPEVLWNFPRVAGVNILQIAGTSVPEEFLKKVRFW